MINVSKKPLPFKGKFDSTLETDDYQRIMTAVHKTEKKSIVIDDAGYLITNHFMRGHAEQGKGNAIFNFFNDLSDRFWNLIETIKLIDKHKVVYVIMHEDSDDFGNIKPKTIGKLLNEKVCIEGMFTICLRACRSDGQYKFRTQSDGLCISKSPFGMFDTELIDNDLKEVDRIIREYYEI